MEVFLFSRTAGKNATIKRLFTIYRFMFKPLTEKPRSTSALSDEQRKAQDERYAQNHEYDYIIIGSGNTSLVTASLLANAGKKVCILEAHDIPGGYAHSFNRGDYYFCAQIHYTWGCGPGGKMHEFLKKLGLEDEITWELYDADGYDRMVMPDGTTVNIPYGWDRLVENMAAEYPQDHEATQKFVDIMAAIRTELGRFPVKQIRWWEYITKGWQFMTLIKYKNATVQDVFDECGLSKEAQAVLIANAGDMMLPPNELSIFSYAGLFGGYNTGAYYPTKHFKHYVDTLVEFIEKRGGHVYYETPVTKVNVEGSKVTSVETADGKTFIAPRVLCNADPQMAARELIGLEHFPQELKTKLEYEYSPAGIMVYLGLKDIDLTQYGFGKHNIWHLQEWDMNESWKKQLSGDLSKPWIFISTPTLHSDAPGTAPEGHEIMEIAMMVDYKSMKDLKDQDPKLYARRKKELSDIMLDFVEKHYIPNLRDHIDMKVVGSPTTNEDFVRNPEGTSYGALMNPEGMGLGRLKASHTPFENFYWCNQSAGYPGIYGTLSTGITLYSELTGDWFYDGAKAPSDDEAIKEVYERLGKKGK